MEIFKSTPFALAAYIVIAVVISTYLGTIMFRVSKTKKEIEHLNSLSGNVDDDNQREDINE